MSSHPSRLSLLRLWDHQTEWNALHHLELLLIFERAKQVSSRRCVLTYRPVRYLELRACMEEVGFTIHKSDYRDDADWYDSVVLVTHGMRGANRGRRVA